MRSSFVVLALATLGLTAMAQAADVYRPPAYGRATAPPQPAYGSAPPPAYAPPPVVAYGAAPGVVAAPEGPAYIVSQPTYQPGGEYVQGPFLVDARRYYRDCWFEWGQLRCVLRPRWFW
jgi:hypothetical protein